MPSLDPGLNMTQILELSDMELKIAMTTMLRALNKKWTTCKNRGLILAERMNQKEMLENKKHHHREEE